MSKFAGGNDKGSDSRFFTTQKKGEMHELRYVNIIPVFYHYGSMASCQVEHLIHYQFPPPNEIQYGVAQHGSGT